LPILTALAPSLSAATPTKRTTNYFFAAHKVAHSDVGDGLFLPSYPGIALNL
jgi:hypothetical protein